jgi:arabinose-5-phosphate isomerase
MPKSNEHILQLAHKTLLIEANALSKAISQIDNVFVESVHCIIQSQGRVIVTGIGKSAIIAQKIVATFNSTGTPAIYMHAADAIHGDLGILQNDDVVICISHSGNTPEIKILVPLLKRGNNKLIAITGNTSSFLASKADFILNASIDQEACPNNLAPTTSTTLQLAIGDALAICLLDYKDFKAEDFAKFHPGGTLGKKLYLRVDDLLHKHALIVVDLTSNVSEIISAITKSRVGAVAVINSAQLHGIITDGDIRRMLQSSDDFKSLNATHIMNKKVKTIQKEALAVDALSLMREFKISQLLVVDGEKAVGIIHIQDLMEEGIL